MSFFFNCNLVFTFFKKFQINTSENNYLVILIIYLCLVFDNILLTIIVPIIPDFINNFNVPKKELTNINSFNIIINQFQDWNKPIKNQIVNNSLIFNHTDQIIYPIRSAKFAEDSIVGILLASKPIVQLLFNPLTRRIIKKFGHFLTQTIGSFILLLSSFFYGFGKNLTCMFIARGIHGIGSSCINISGFTIIASIFPEDKERCRAIGTILGGIATGVLIGYPFGGFLYGFFNRSTPFIILALLISLVIGTQIIIFKSTVTFHYVWENITLTRLILDKDIIFAIGSIFLATCSIPILETCLPVWIYETINPPKWQMGTLFIPDSVGYLLGVNFGGIKAFQFGRWRTTITSFFFIGISAILISLAINLYELIVPHFALGFGLGTIDAAMMPHLASLMDTRYESDYATVYTLSQTAVCLAYLFGPLVTGQLFALFGFPMVMKGYSILVVVFAITCILLYHSLSNNCLNQWFSSKAKFLR